jgi:hypothetical protein
MVQLGTSEAICPQCNGAGEYLQESENMQWAADRILKISNLPEEKGSGVQVNVQNNVSVKSSGDFMERMAKAAHAVVGRTSIIDAEVIKASSSTPQES